MPEQVGILLLFLVVVLFNLIGGFLNRRRKRPAADAESTAAQGPPRPLHVPPRMHVPPRRVSPPTPLDVARPAAPSPIERRRRRILTTRDLRRAIVMMTILGPPRALDDERHERSG